MILEVCAAIIINEGKYLICKRAKDDTLGGLWEFPGGKKEYCENLEECIVREIYEELELEIKIDDLYAQTIALVNERPISFTFFLCSCSSRDLKMNVHDEIAWISKNDFKKYDFMPADKEVLEMIEMA